MLNIKRIENYDEFMYDEKNEMYLGDYFELKEIKIDNFDNLKFNIDGNVENKENWGEVFVFEYDNKKLFTDSYSPYKNEYIVYEYSDNYSCDIYGLMSI